MVTFCIILLPSSYLLKSSKGTIKVPWMGKNHQLGHTLANLCPSGAYTRISHRVVAISARVTAIDTTAILVLSTSTFSDLSSFNMLTSYTLGGACEKQRHSHHFLTITSLTVIKVPLHASTVYRRRPSLLGRDVNP